MMMPKGSWAGLRQEGPYPPSSGHHGECSPGSPLGLLAGKG